jgi:RimJ/RimL family protein N-acetyltransferase
MTSAAAHGQAAHPPEQVSAGPLLLRRMRESDAGPVADAVGASLHHLRPWMAWATPEAADHRVQMARISEVNELWETGSDYVYTILLGDGTVAGTIGMHRRVGDGGIEIGYWIALEHIRHGYATAAAGALTPVALALPGVSRVEIHCDEANTASAGVPRKLGYRLDRVDDHEPEAPGEQGRRMIWVWDPRPAGPPRRRAAKGRG